MMTIKNKAYDSISTIQKLLNSEDIISSNILEKEYNFEISASLNGKRFKIQVYFGKKGEKTIIQGDSSSKEYQTIQSLILDQPKLNFPDTTISEPEEYIGSDECGKGDFFGPLVIAAVFVNPDTQKKLKQLGVRDSKDLNEVQITKLAKPIKEIVGENFEIIKINPEKYNLLYEKLSNLNKLLNWAHSKSIENLLIKTSCKTVITDKFSNRDLNVSSNNDHISVKFIQETKAEKYVGVAAASIIARDEFNRWFNHQKKLGHDLPKGASDLVIDATNKLIASERNINLGDFVKLHFKTTKKIKTGR